jgi:hypothetical protein
MRRHRRPDPAVPALAQLEVLADEAIHVAQQLRTVVAELRAEDTQHATTGDDDDHPA